MTYQLIGFFTSLCVYVPREKREDRVRIPQKIYDACWLDRVLNTYVQVLRFDKDGVCQSVFYWPARKMEPPERVSALSGVGHGTRRR